jgi:hypothetical protein
MILILFTLVILFTNNSLIFNSAFNTHYNSVLGKNIIKAPTKRPIPTLTQTPTPTLTPTFTPTPTPTPIPVIITSPSLEDLFIKYGKQYNVDKELLKKIAGCESGFNPNAVKDDYAGLFQFASFAWIEARGRMGLSNDLSLRFNAEESIRTAAFEINYKGTSGWSDCDK